MLHARDPHLLSGHDIPIAATTSEGTDPRRVGAARRFRDGERLEAKLAGRNAREIAPFLLLRPVTEERSHDVHLRVTRPRVRARPVDLLEDHRRLGDTESTAAVFGGDENREPAGVRERLHERPRVRALCLHALPVVAAERTAQVPHRFAVFAVLLCVWVDVVHRVRLASRRTRRSCECSRRRNRGVYG